MDRVHFIKAAIFCFSDFALQNRIYLIIYVISYTKEKSRILYFFVVGRRIVLTNGFIKKSQKTPRNEIEKAKRYRADYLSRMETK